MQLIDPKHPFFQPAWRRWLLVAVPFAWAFVEMYHGSMIWAYLSAGIGGFLAYNLIFTWPRQND